MSSTWKKSPSVRRTTRRPASRSSAARVATRNCRTRRQRSRSGVTVMKKHSLLLVVGVAALLQLPASAQQQARHGDEAMLPYLKGQTVVPIFHGWQQKPDGTYTLYWSYINRNWEEQIDIPIGPNNNVTAPYGPDAGQPTHFYPRQNRWIFTTTVPK